jgi:phage shock protein PspC (stress-responsive transcriptional regulator)
MIGGDGGLMDGFGLILILCFTASISALIYLIAWAALPAMRRSAE